MGKQNNRKIQTILISQPEPEMPTKSPYHLMAEKLHVAVEFRQFIKVEGLHARDFRKSRIAPLDFTAVIFTSRNAVNHFFRLCEELRAKMPQNTKYFCISEAIALYLQKFILYRKRKVFFDKASSLAGLKELLKKHKKNDKFLFPCAADRKDNIEQYLTEENFDFSPAVMFETVSENISDLDIAKFDMLIFFSPMGIKSLIENFPQFQQTDIIIGAFGPTTSQAVIDAGLRLDFQAPMPGVPSITMAIEKYITEHSGAGA